MFRNKSFDFRAKFGAIFYSASETIEYVLKNIPIDNRQTLELLVPKIHSGDSF